MRIARVVVVLFALVGSAAYTASASACSLAPRAEAERFAEAEGAFIGVVTSAPAGGAGLRTYVFRVDEVHKGTIGETIELQADSGITPTDGGFAWNSCGLTFQLGERQAVYLSRADDGSWRTSLPQLTTLEKMRAAAAAPPPPSSTSSTPPSADAKRKARARARAAAKRRAAARRRAAKRRAAARRRAAASGRARA